MRNPPTIYSYSVWFCLCDFFSLSAYRFSVETIPGYSYISEQRVDYLSLLMHCDKKKCVPFSGYWRYSDTGMKRSQKVHWHTPIVEGHDLDYCTIHKVGSHPGVLLGFFTFDVRYCNCLFSSKFQPS